MNRQFLDAVLTAIALLGVWGSTSFGSEKTGPRNGFYYVTEQQRLGDAVTLEIRKAELRSLDNFNSAFLLTIMTPDAEKEEPPFELLVENHRYRCSGRGAGGEKTYHFSGINEKQARQIAKYLRIKPQVRSHPGYRLAVQFRTEKKNYALGEPVRVRMTIKNVGTNVLSFMAMGIVRKDDQFSFLATHNGRPLPAARDRPTRTEISQGRIQLKPQEEFEKEAELSGWFELDKDGQYTLLGAYYLEVVPNGGTLATCRTIWEDYATGRFKFRIIGPRHVSARSTEEGK